MNTTQTTGVIGAGTMGTGIAQVCAVAGLSVVMLDVDAARAARGKDAVATALERLVTNDSPGFVVNRLLCPMLNETVLLFSEAVASAPDIDEAMKLGCNHPIGPLALCDLIGIDVVLAVMEVFHREFKDPKYRPAPLLTQMVGAGHLGRKSGHGFYTYG